MLFLFFFLPFGTLLSFGSFLVTEDEHVNPSLLPFIQWENAEPAFTKLAAGYWWRKECIKLPSRSPWRKSWNWCRGFSHQSLCHQPSGMCSFAVRFWPSQQKVKSSGMGVQCGAATSLQVQVITQGKQIWYYLPFASIPGNIINCTAKKALNWHKPQELHFLMISVFLRVEWLLLG